MKYEKIRKWHINISVCLCSAFYDIFTEASLHNYDGDMLQWLNRETEGYHLVSCKVATEYQPIGPDCLLLKQQQIVHISWPLQWYHRQSRREMYEGRVC